MLLPYDPDILNKLIYHSKSISNYNYTKKFFGRQFINKIKFYNILL